jgi:M6 family metalloprotease-like protein
MPREVAGDSHPREAFSRYSFSRAVPVHLFLALLGLGVLAAAGGAQPAPAAAAYGKALPSMAVEGLDVWPTAPLEFGRAWLQKAESVRRVRAELHAEGLLDGLSPEDLARVGAALSGELRVPVIAVRYADVEEPFATDLLSDRLFGETRGDTMTFRDYWREVSGGLLDVDGVVTSWVTLRRPARHYLAREEFGWGRLGRIGEFRQQVLSLVDPYVDFSQFDNDGPDGIPNSGDDDGFVDFVVFLYATGCGEGPRDGAIWPHRGAMSPYETLDKAAGGGRIRISDYVVLPAQSPGRCEEPAHIGVLAHETAHGFGMPDLYDYDGSSPGEGPWGLMGTGSHNSPHSPAHPSAWVKEQLGWVAVEWLTPGETVVLPPVQRSRRIFRYDAPDRSGRYVLMENRTREGSDRDLPAGGLLVWGIDPERGELGVWNGDERRPAVGLLRTDGAGALVTAGGHALAGPFPGSLAPQPFGDRFPFGLQSYQRASGDVTIRLTTPRDAVWEEPKVHLAAVIGGDPVHWTTALRPGTSGTRRWQVRAFESWLQLSRSGHEVSLTADPRGLTTGRHSGWVELVDERTGRVLDRLTVTLEVLPVRRPAVVATDLPWGWGLAVVDGALIHPGTGWDLLGIRPRPRLLRVERGDIFPRTHARLPVEALYAPAPGPDGGVYVLATARGDHYLYHVDAAGDARIVTGDLGTEPAYGLARLPDGSLLVAEWSGRIHQVRAGGEVSRWSDLEQPIYQIAADEAGNVYVALLSGNVLRVEPSGAARVLVTGFERGRLVAVAVAPGGRAFAAERGGGGRIVELTPVGPSVVAAVSGGEFYGLAACNDFVYGLDLRHRRVVRAAIEGPGVRPLAGWE